MSIDAQGPCIGVGVHGRVYRARHKITGDMVALKKICFPDVGSGIALAALREIAVLKELRSDCLIRLIDGAYDVAKPEYKAKMTS